MVELWPIAAAVAIVASALPATILALRKDGIGLRRLFTSIGLGLSLGFSFLLAAVWVAAVLAGGTISITVNGQNEAYAEAVALAISLPAIAYGTLRVLVDQIRSFGRPPTSAAGPAGRATLRRSPRPPPRPSR